MYSDEIIDGVGGMSKFQLLALFLFLGPKLITSWGMLMMSFAGVTPQLWWCVNKMTSGASNYTGLKHCSVDDNSSLCSYVYSMEKNTVVNEWDFVCDRAGIRLFITSVQMGGVLVGALLSGQSADVIGRKKTFYIALLLHGGFNLVAAFSVSWQMFIVLRFLIGAMVGSNLVVSYPYAMEFIGRSWRQITSAFPTWQVGSALFAMSCWLRPDWSDQHIILAALHIPFFACWFVAPESLRWLAVHGKLEEAEKVVDQMARYNNREKPANTAILLKKLSEVEKKGQESDHKYNYLDIYRHWNICWKSLVIQVIWMCMSFAFYGITFGVGNLMGNLYLNMFLVSVISIPGQVMVFFLSSRIGRRWTTFSFFYSSYYRGIWSGYYIETSSDSIRGPATTTMTLICRLGVATAWNSFQISTSETYPTVIRNLGYGAANTAARVGSIVSPYAFAMGGEDLLPPFVIVGSTMALCTLLTVLLPETNNTPLADTTVQTLGKDYELGRAVEDVSQKKTEKVSTLEI
ncbi:solute carrier family 22 member 5-like [Haliotis rubra]|uniref:solute carrier family 22 member 5-like n=1 Tax=Haliotis rubra TaxID=36100 RepID=UPI001EE524E5|nr:solute carrier family 22 member 5-like [Haliotis rubra]